MKEGQILLPEIPSAGQLNCIPYSPVQPGGRGSRQGLVWIFVKHLTGTVKAYWKV